MKALKKWMVGLDLTDHDDHLIKYTYELAQHFVPEEIIFIYIKTRLNVPDRMKDLFDEGLSRKEALEIIESKVYSLFTESYNVKCEVHEGTPYFDLWRETHLHGTDLFILGEKNKKDGRRIIPEKFVRKSFCSVLFVPENASTNFERILVPIDMSDHSKEALEAAYEIQRNLTGVEVGCQYVFDTPSSDLVDPSMRNDYRDFIGDMAKADVKDYLKQFEFGDQVRSIVEPKTLDDVSDHIHAKADSKNVSLVIIGSGGKSLFSSIFMGSTTEQLIGKEKAIPILILKKKKDKVKAWDILTHL